MVAELLDTNEAKSLLAYESDSISQLPHVSNQMVHFNGKGGDGHETFLFKRDNISKPWKDTKSGKVFNFCKTARKSYDVAVTACLVLAKHHFGDDVNVSSDGEFEDWRRVSSWLMTLWDIIRQPKRH